MSSSIEQNLKRKNQAPLKLIVAGLPRTGTKSMRDALEELGINCHHMSELYKHRSQEKIWLEALKNGGLEPKQWDELFNDYKYGAVSDVPSCLFVKELAEIYPEAKIIILERDPEEWIRSVEKTIAIIRPGFETWIAKNFAQKLYKSNMRDFCDAILYPPHGIFPSKSLDPQVLPDYIHDLRSHFSRLDQSSRVLVTSISTLNYKVLCNFISVDLPPGNPPFPNTNNSEGSKNKGATKGTSWDETTGQLNELREEIVKKRKNIIEGIMGVVAMTFCFVACSLVYFGVSAALTEMEKQEAKKL